MTTTVKSNLYPARCERPACGRTVSAGAGILERRNGRNCVWCRDCYPGQVAAAAAPAVRELTADGRIVTPYEPENLNVVRSFPGARWNAAGKYWTVSTDAVDRPRVLELAARIGLRIAPELAVAPVPAVPPHGEPPAGKALFPFQAAGVDFLALRDRALLGDDMGVGKTIQALIALPPAASVRAVVVCPSCVKYNWRNETAAWRPDLRTEILEGRGSFRIPEPGEVVIVNYDILPAEPPAGWADAGVSMIVDEAHMVKNYKALRTKRVSSLAKAAARVWFLTGTPLLNRPFDLFGVLCAGGLEKKVFGGFGGFLRAFNGQPGRWGGYEFGAPEPYVAEKLRNVMLRRTKAEVLPDLPPKIYSRLVVNGLPSSLRRKMDSVWGETDISVRDESDDLPPFEEFSRIRAELAEARIPALLELVESYEEQETPLVVFSAHRAPVLALAGRDGWAAITGDTAPEERAAIVSRFQAGELRGVALTIAAGGVGLTLTRASTVLFVDLDWTPALNQQAEDRCHRIGQTAESLQIIRMVADHPLEQHVHDLLDAKQRMIAAAVDGGSVAGRIPVPETADPGESAEAFAARRERIAAEDRRYNEERAAREAAARTERARGRVAGFLARRPDADCPPELADTVRAAFGSMLAVCDGAEQRDGAGFNKPDAFVAHVVLDAGLDTSDALNLAYRILRGYPRQLRSAYPGIFE